MEHQNKTALLKPEEAAARLGIGVRALRTLIATGQLPVVMISPRVRRVPSDALDRWAQDRATRSGQERTAPAASVTEDLK